MKGRDIGFVGAPEKRYIITAVTVTIESRSSRWRKKTHGRIH